MNSYDFLLRRARQCAEQRGKKPNIVAVDFYGIGDLLPVVNRLNGIESAAKLAEQLTPL